MPRRLYKCTSRTLHSPHIHLTIISSVLSRVWSVFLLNNLKIPTTSSCQSGKPHPSRSKKIRHQRMRPRIVCSVSSVSVLKIIIFLVRYHYHLKWNFIHSQNFKLRRESSDWSYCNLGILSRSSEIMFSLIILNQRLWWKCFSCMPILFVALLACWLQFTRNTFGAQLPIIKKHKGCD